MPHSHPVVWLRGQQTYVKGQEISNCGFAHPMVPVPTIQHNLMMWKQPQTIRKRLYGWMCSLKVYLQTSVASWIWTVVLQLHHVKCTMGKPLSVFSRCPARHTSRSYSAPQPHAYPRSAQSIPKLQMRRWAERGLLTCVRSQNRPEGSQPVHCHDTCPLSALCQETLLRSSPDPDDHRLSGDRCWYEHA